MAPIWWENVTGRVADGLDVEGSTATNPFSTFRNVTDCEVLNSHFHGVRQRNASDHVDGLKVDLAKNLRLYRCTFSDNDICHLLLSYRFWSSTVLPRDSDGIVVEQCRFDSGHSSYGNAFYFHVQIQADAKPKNVVFKDCYFRAGTGILGGAPQSVLDTIQIINPTIVPVGAAWPAYPGETPPPPPPPPPPDPDPVPTVDERIAALEQQVPLLGGLLDQRVSDLEAMIASVDSRVKAEEAWVVAQDAHALAAAHDGRLANVEANKATRPETLDVTVIRQRIAAIKAANPKISASDEALLDGLINLYTSLRA